MRRSDKEILARIAFPATMRAIDAERVEAVTGLVAKWESEAATYPEHRVEGATAAAAVRLCAEELRAALRLSDA